MQNTIKIVSMSVLVLSMFLLAACTTEDTSKVTQNNRILTNDEQEINPEIQTQELSAKGEYTDYYASSIEESIGESVLFFHADWCPSCRSADKEFSEQVVPAGVNVIKVNYDDEEELKETYEITSQHTFVYVDKEGNMIKKWTGGGISEIEQNIQ